MSYTPLPAPSSAAANSIWARRQISKPIPTSEAEVELNILSLLLDVPDSPLPSPVSPVHSPWTTFQPTMTAAPLQRSRSMDLDLDMHAAQVAVKAALDVLEEPSLSRGLRISTSNANTNALGLRGCLTAPLSPVSPAESSFSGDESGQKKKGRARMSQEKRKRLARRREREALVSGLSQQDYHLSLDESKSAPTSPMQSYFPTTPLYNTTSGWEGMPSPALTTTSLRTSSWGSIGTPHSSPFGGSEGLVSSSPPTLVIQPPSPQRLRKQQQQQDWSHQFMGASHLASVF